MPGTIYMVAVDAKPWKRICAHSPEDIRDYFGPARVSVIVPCLDQWISVDRDLTVCAACAGSSLIYGSSLCPACKGTGIAPPGAYR